MTGPAASGTLSALWAAACASTQSPPHGWRLRREPQGVLCFHRASGLNVLFDEVRVAAGDVDRVPRYVQWSLLDACNLRCEFCYASKAGHRWKPEECLKLARDLDRWGVLEIAIAGGEPLVYPGIADLIVAIWTSTTLAVHLTTNALRVPDGFRAAVQGYVGQIRVSVDGVGDTYEHYRGAPFRDLERGLERLLGLRLGLNCLATERTLREVERLYDFAEERGIRDVLLLRPLGIARFLDNATPGLVRDAVTRGVSRGFRVLTSAQLGGAELPVLFPRSDCGCGRDFIYITSDRRVMSASTAPEAYAFRNVEELRDVHERRLATGQSQCACRERRTHA